MAKKAAKKTAEQQAKGESKAKNQAKADDQAAGSAKAKDGGKAGSQAKAKDPAGAKAKNPAGAKAAGKAKGSAGVTGKVEEFREFFEESKVELKKVTWPSRKETLTTSVAVVVLTVIVSLFLGVVDLGLAKIVEAILS
jgi:preprotein translocase subunit SecE